MTGTTARTPRSILWSPWLFGLLVSAVLQYVDWTPVQRIDLALFDLVAPSGHPKTLDDTVVVAIDDASIGVLGAWPWSRRHHAAMIDRLHGAGVAAIGYDVLFTEPSSIDPGGDDALVKALRRSNRVVLPIAPSPTRDGVAALVPLSAFASAARTLGHVDVEIDADAIARRIFLQAGVGAPSLPALPVALTAVRRDRPSPLPGRRAPARDATGASTWTRDFEVLVPHATAAMPTASFAAVLRDPVLAATFKDKTVFVGVTATGIAAPLTTAIANIQAPMPAIEFLAWTDVALRAGATVTPLAPVESLGLALVVLIALALWAPRFSASRSVAVGAAIGLPLAISIVLLHAGQLWFAPAAATVGLIAGNLLWRSYRLRDVGRQLFRAQQQAEATLQAIADGVITVDPRQRIVYANPVAQQLGGRSDLRNLPVADLFADDPPHRRLVAGALDDCMVRQATVRIESDLSMAGDAADAPDARLVRVTVTPLTDARGHRDGAVLVLHDVTEAAAAAARLDHAATHDALTGLPNRVLFRERLQQAIAEGKHSEDTVATLFVDLDRFKRINDSLGHRFGDQVLKLIAERLRTSSREVDTVARWGGDEFVVLLHGLPTREAIATAARRLMQAIAQTMDINGMELRCTCSLGIALAPHDASDVDSLLAMADLAMYRGRARSGGHFAFYSPEMALWTRDRLQLESDLRKALAQGEFELHYQTQVDLASGEPVGLEALLRWRNAYGELVMPDDFIGVAEESGLILAIGEWVILEAAGQIARWTAEGLPVLPVAVNVSARQCLDHGIVRTMRDALAHTAIEPRLLMLEITETTAMRDVEHVIELLGQISALGVGIAVDDFGTGYSSLAYLKRFPIDQLKIDQSFIRDITTDSNDAAIVVAILALAHSLGWPVVAEGVETDAQRAFLAEQHCDLAQGYLFCRPMLAAELVESLHWRTQAIESAARPMTAAPRD